ncbi:MAG: glutamine-hydrolyzing carbamoyl-phosphate synthase small subunit [Chthoniobacterales bacterium]|nr:glutamine-hydrolyzing carbamoyl-phosphate synthase small subunit [Chthoniobacterales bacterium]
MVKESTFDLEESPAILALEDGRVFEGISFGAKGTATGEVCFNTSMTGYQEILTDPSYRGQIVTMTYPEIGNYGVNSIDEECDCPQVRGFVIAELSPIVSSWRATESLDSYLRRHSIPGIRGVDTRALTKHLRKSGAMRGCITSDFLDKKMAIQIAQECPPMEGADFVRDVTPACATDWDFDSLASRKWLQKKYFFDKEVQFDEVGNCFEPLSPVLFFVVVLDFGVKRNILRLLRQNGCKVRRVPSTTSAEEILSLNPDGVLLSNGPGDPAALTYAHKTIRELVGKVPIFGICLGHQLLALALGGRTFKLKFGHRGANHPILDTTTKKIAITSQNHGFAVDPNSLPPELEITHWNLNDHTVAGLQHRKFAAFSVQYHPEASPGPHDSEDLFRRFIESVRQEKKSKGRKFYG